MRISDLSSDVCSSDLEMNALRAQRDRQREREADTQIDQADHADTGADIGDLVPAQLAFECDHRIRAVRRDEGDMQTVDRQTEHAAQRAGGAQHDAERDAADQSTKILIDVFGQALHAAFADHGAQTAQFPEPLRNTVVGRWEEHTSELKSLMRISYAVFCLKKKTYDLVNQ